MNTVNRVNHKESIIIAIIRIPFLRRFVTSIKDTWVVSSEEINKYMGFEYVSFQEEITSKSINRIIEEAEERGDLI